MKAKVNVRSLLMGTLVGMMIVVGGGAATDLTSRIPSGFTIPPAAKDDVGEIAYDFELQATTLIVGTVLDTEGQPVEGAQIVLKTPSSRLRLAGKSRFENLDSIAFPVTDRNGTFRLANDPEATHLVAVHERGIAWIEAAQILPRLRLKLQPWGRIEGEVWDYDQPAANQDVWHSSLLLTQDVVDVSSLLNLFNQGVSNSSLLSSAVGLGNPFFALRGTTPAVRPFDTG